MSLPASTEADDGGDSPDYRTILSTPRTIKYLYDNRIMKNIPCPVFASSDDLQRRIQLCSCDILQVPQQDAIVNAANINLTSGGGICGAIFKAAGEDELRIECEKFPGGINEGEAVTTSGCKLRNRHIIHAVGPYFTKGEVVAQGDRRWSLLHNCYRAIVDECRIHNCKTVVIPVISIGLFNAPWEECIATASRAIVSSLQRPENRHITVTIVVFDEKHTVKWIQEYLHNLEFLVPDPAGSP